MWARECKLGRLNIGCASNATWEVVPDFARFCAGQGRFVDHIVRVRELCAGLGRAVRGRPARRACGSTSTHF